MFETPWSVNSCPLDLQESFVRLEVLLAKFWFRERQVSKSSVPSRRAFWWEVQLKPSK